MDRRELLQAGLTAVAGTVDARRHRRRPRRRPAPAARPRQSRPLGAHPLTAPFEGWTGTMLEVTYAPGRGERVAPASRARRSATSCAAASSGRLTASRPRCLTAGQSFFEPLGSVHSTSANASATEPAVISVVIVGKTGEPLSKPATAAKTGA